jgi:hypothetical protein
MSNVRQSRTKIDETAINLNLDIKQQHVNHYNRVQRGQYVNTLTSLSSNSTIKVKNLAN